MKSIGRSVCFAAAALAAVLFSFSCASPDGVHGGTAERQEKRLKVALYLDSGSAGNGVWHWIRLISHSPQLELHGVTGKDVRAGKLEGMDVLVMPGGRSPRQYRSLREEGARKVREFVRAGGAYLGTCAGLAGTLDAPERLKLLPFVRKPASGGATAILTVEFPEAGARILDIAPGRYKVRYSGGPIPVPGKKTGGGSGGILAVYRNTVSYVNKPEGNFFGEAALIFGRLGRGKVIAAGFHPEYWESTHPIVTGCFYAVTGVKPVFAFPRTDPRPVRVGFWAAGIPDDRRIQAMLSLDRCPDADLRIVSSHQLDLGELRHLDALVVAGDPAGAVQKSLSGKYIQEQLAAFMERGGAIFVSGTAAAAVPARRNRIELPEGADFVGPVLQRFAPAARPVSKKPCFQ
ncbi:MAG: hypothetical protein IJT50_07290 [Lentisphaeria bacterium]|nr:hypothetical protein [Lentisphaeria bacterium]